MIVAALTVAMGVAVLLVPVGAPSRRPGRPESPTGPARRFRRRSVEILDQADVEIDPRRVVPLWAAVVAIAALVGLVLGGVAGMVVGSVLGVVGPPGWLLSRGDRRRQRVIASLPELLELVARGLRGGADLRTALGEAAASVPGSGPTLAPVLQRVAAGARLGDALDRWVADIDHPDAAVVRAVLRLGDTTGAALAGALDRAAATLRDRAALRAELAALTSQTRASSMVVACAPLGFLLVVASTDPRSAEVLFTTFWGRLCLVVGLGLDAVGILWMRRLTAAVGR